MISLAANGRTARLIRPVLFGLLFFLSACRTPATLSPTTSPTSPAPTSTPQPETGTILPTTQEHSGPWNLRPNYPDAGAVDWLTAAEDGYRLDPAFPVAAIDLSFRWFGIGDTIQISERIERRGAEYWRDDTLISPAAVQALIRSITHLHPQPQMLGSTPCSDDYPSWTIELTADDGSRLLLYSESNVTDFVPWNVAANGRLYAQFDGQIVAVLPALFEIAEDLPPSGTGGCLWPLGYLIVNGVGLPAQLTSGFHGLLPFDRVFEYTADPEQGELRGHLRTDIWGAGTGGRILGAITEVLKMKVEIADGRTVACSLESITYGESSALAWDFTCPVGLPDGHATYRYPIHLILTTDRDQVHTLSGEILGYWQPGTAIAAAPFPDEITAILAASPVAADLLSDHQAAVVDVVAEVDPASDSLVRRWEATVALLGQVQTGDRILPYTVTIQVKIEESRLVHWDLDRSELLDLLRDALDQPITERFLMADPDLVLNLAYGEIADYPLVPAQDLQPCADLPVAPGLPSPEQPLRAFGFNRPWGLGGLQFLLLDGEVRLRSLTINPARPEHAVWVSMLPAELQPRGAPPFREIIKRVSGASIGVFWNETATAADIATYQAMFEGWDVEQESRDQGIILDGVAFDVGADGNLSLVFCAVP